MTTLMCSAFGASAFTQTDYYPTSPLDEHGLFVADHSSTPPHSWSQLIDDLLVIRNLENDWDGQGAEAPHPALVDYAITLAQRFLADERLRKSPADRVIAGVNGTIIFEWHTPAEYVELEVTAPGEAEGRTVRKGSDEVKKFTLSHRS